MVCWKITGWWCNNHLEKSWTSSMGLGWHPIYDGKFKKLPKHQPAKLPMWTVGKLGRKIRTPSPDPFLALWNKVPPIWTEKTIIWLVVLTILKNMSSSVGIIVPNIWEVMKFHGSSHHQPVMFPLGLPFGWCLESGIPANPKPYHPDIRKLHDFTRKKNITPWGRAEKKWLTKFLIQCLFQVLSPTVFGPRICSDVVAATAALLL